MPNYCLIILLLLSLLLSPAFAAQQSGNVRSGELAIPGATVTATLGDKKVVTTADDSGQYVFNDLPAGAWTLQVEMFGFAAARRDVTVGDAPSSLEWNLELKPRSQPAPVSEAKPPAPAVTAKEAAPSKPAGRREATQTAAGRGR